MVHAYSPVCLMPASGALSTGNVHKASAFSLPGMHLISYLNCCMYDVHLSILAQGGFEFGPSTMISGFCSTQISKSFPWMCRKNFSQLHFTARASLSNRDICLLEELAYSSNTYWRSICGDMGLCSLFEECHDWCLCQLPFDCLEGIFFSSAPFPFSMCFGQIP